MGATLADGGVNPVTGERVVDAAVCHYTLAVMLTAGLYETLGRLAVRRRPAGQERHRRRDRDGLAGQGRDRAPSRRRSTPPATASRGSSSPRFLSARLGLDLLISAPESGVHG